MPITKSDVLSLIQDAEERNLLKERSEDKEVVNNPLSYLRFDPFMMPFVKYQEKIKKDPKFGFEEEGQVDIAKDIERAIIGGGVKLGKSIGEFITAGVDLSGKTELTKKLDEVTNDFLNKHGDPKLLSTQIGEFVLQLGGGYKVAASMIANVGKLKNIKKLQTDLLKKFPALTTGKYLAPTFQFSKKVGTGALSLGAADMLAMDSERETFVIEKTPEEGKTGRDLAIARLANKIKFGQEGAVLGGGIPLVGKGLSVGFRYGIWKPAKFTGKMGLKGLNFAVVNPLSKGLARVPYLEQGVGIVKNLPAKAFDKSGLPPFKQWNLFTVNDNIALRRFLKRSDNVLSALKSIGRQTPEQADVAFKGEKLIKERARSIEKLLDSLEARAYTMVKSQKKMYDTKTTSPASMEKYLDETMEYLRGQRSLEKIQAPLRPVAKEILKITDDIKKEFRDVLPKDSELLPNLLGNALRGYWRKSFGIFTNPNYSVPENSKVFKDAVNFVKKIKSLDVDDMVKEVAKRERYLQNN